VTTRRVEHRIHTPEQVREIVAGALEIAEGERVPGELREAVFVAACGLLAQKQVTLEQGSVAGGRLAVPGRG
jgi:hypothetical protein